MAMNISDMFQDIANKIEKQVQSSNLSPGLPTPYEPVTGAINAALSDANLLLNAGRIQSDTSSPAIWVSQNKSLVIGGSIAVAILIMMLLRRK